MSSVPYSLQSRKGETRLRTCGVIDLCVGAAVVLVGLDLALANVWVGIVALLGGLALWAGSMRIRGRAAARAERLDRRLQQNVDRHALRDQHSGSRQRTGTTASRPRGDGLPGTARVGGGVYVR